MCKLDANTLKRVILPSFASSRLNATAHACKRRKRTQARTARRSRLSHRWRHLLSPVEHPAHHLHTHSSSKHAKMCAKTACLRQTRLKQRHTRESADNARRHVPLVAPASATAGVSFSAGQNAPVTSCGDTAAEKQHTKASVDTGVERGRMQGWCREAPFRGERRQTAG